MKGQGKNSNTGFTLAEVLVATAIIAVIVGGLFYFLTSNLRVMKHGERQMLLQQEISNIMNNLYFEIKKINPPVYIDDKFDIWLSGEKLKEAKPLQIELYDMDNNLANGFERLCFTEYVIEPVWTRRYVEFYLEGTRFLKTVDKKKTVPVGNWVESIHFNYDKRHLDRLEINATVKIPGDRQAPEIMDSFNLRIKVDNKYVTFVERIKEN